MSKQRLKKIKFRFSKLPDAWGLAYADKWEIHLDKRLDEKTLLDIAIHEGLHCLFPDLSEEAVNQAGITLADLLWRLGYRRNEEE